MNKPMVVLCPGYVWSIMDDQKHFINAPKLAELYGIPFRRCKVLHWDRDPHALRQYPPDTIFLGPRSHAEDYERVGTKVRAELGIERNGN